MRKLLLAICILLAGCQNQPQYYLYVYYAKTCPICHSFIEQVLPQLEETYGKQMKITQLDIDEETSIESYAKTCSLLKDYYNNDHSGSVPFIVLDGYFAKEGYDIDSEQAIITAIEDAVQGREISVELKDIYYFQAGKTFH